MLTVIWGNRRGANIDSHKQQMRPELRDWLRFELFTVKGYRTASKQDRTPQPEGALPSWKVVSLDISGNMVRTVSEQKIRTEVRPIPD